MTENNKNSVKQLSVNKKYKLKKISKNIIYNKKVKKKKKDFTRWDFSGGPVVKNPPANAGNMGSIPGPGRSLMLWSN